MEPPLVRSATMAPAPVELPELRGRRARHPDRDRTLMRGDLVVGVTTAATLWVITVIGLCFGGGQLGLGIAATLLGAITLWALNWFDRHIPRQQRAVLVIKADLALFSPSQLTDLIAPLGYEAQFRQQNGDRKHARLCFDIGWRRPEVAGPPLDLLKLVNEHYSILSFQLSPPVRH